MSHSHAHAHGAHDADHAHGTQEQKSQDADLLEAVKAAAASMTASGRGPLPVTVLSGFLGAGKTTLMTQIACVENQNFTTPSNRETRFRTGTC